MTEFSWKNLPILHKALIFVSVFAIGILQGALQERVLIGQAQRLTWHHLLIAVGIVAVGTFAVIGVQVLRKKHGNILIGVLIFALGATGLLGFGLACSIKAVAYNDDWNQPQSFLVLSLATGMLIGLLAVRGSFRKLFEQST